MKKSVFITLADSKAIHGSISNSIKFALNEINVIKNLDDLPSKAFMEIKANRVEEVRIRYEASSKNEILLDCWFSQPSQDLLQEAAKKFSK